jgi:hypothetical protein
MVHKVSAQIMGSHIVYKTSGFKIRVKNRLADESFEIHVETPVSTLVNPY